MSDSDYFVSRVIDIEEQIHALKTDYDDRLQRAWATADDVPSWNLIAVYKANGLKDDIASLRRNIANGMRHYQEGVRSKQVGTAQMVAEAEKTKIILEVLASSVEDIEERAGIDALENSE